MKMRPWKECPPPVKLWRSLIFALALAGISLIASGAWIKAKAELAQILLDRSFAQTVAGKVNVRPWPWADITPIGRISVGRLNRNVVILNDASGEALAFGPALVIGSPKPGEEGTSIISGHRDTHFSWLRYLNTGDDVDITNSKGDQLRFRVKGTRIARYDEANIDVGGFGKMLALTTCYPFDAETRGPLRYIVEAELIHQTKYQSDESDYLKLALTR